jgi:hypothetical protein
MKTQKRPTEADRRRARAQIERLSDEQVLGIVMSQRVPSEREFIEACQIEDKETGMLVPFTLWPAQVEILPRLGEKRLFALKARQLGITWLDLAHWLYEATFWGSRLILVARQTHEDALDAIHRLKVLRAALPEEWQATIVGDRRQSLTFANGSRFRALTTTKRMGRSHAAYGALIDEFCFWDAQEEELLALEAACERLHIVSSGNGAGDHAHKLWRQAERSLGVWKTLFLPWHAHPGRDEAWYAQNVLAAASPRLARREYASTPEEAFAAPEGVFFERFSRERNVAEIEILPNWETYRCLDFGYHSPACAWIQVSPKGQQFVVGELTPHDLTTDEFAEAILEKEKSFGLIEQPRHTYADPAGNAVNSQSSRSEVQIFRRHGIHCRSKSSGVREGCVLLMNALADPELPLVVAKSCHWTIEALASVPPDPHQPERYDERSPYEHILDALRYFMVNSPPTGRPRSSASSVSRPRPPRGPRLQF